MRNFDHPENLLLRKCSENVQGGPSSNPKLSIIIIDNIEKLIVSCENIRFLRCNFILHIVIINWQDFILILCVDRRGAKEWVSKQIVFNV